MKVWFIESYPQVVYGQQIILLGLLDSLRPRQWEYRIAVPGDGPFVQRAREEGHRCEVFPYPTSLARYGGAIYRDRIWARLRLASQWLRYVLSLLMRMRQDRPDVLFCNDMRGLLTFGMAARILGIPVMIWDKLDQPHGWLDALQLPLAQCNVIIAGAVAEKYPRWQRRWYRSRIHRIADGVDWQKIAAAHSQRTALGYADDELLIGIVGSISLRKGHDLLLSIWDRFQQQVPQARLLIVGDAEDEQQLQRWQEQAGPAVNWLGRRDDVPEMLASLDMLLLPSRQEGLCRVAVEALAAGLAVIAADAGGLAELIENEVTGILIPRDDTEALFTAMQRLAADAGLRERLGRVGRARVEADFDHRVQHHQLGDLLASLGAGSQSASAQS